MVSNHEDQVNQNKEDICDLRDQNIATIEVDAADRSPIAHGQPHILTWTNTIAYNARCEMCNISRDKALPPDHPRLPFSALEALAPHWRTRANSLR